MTTRAVEQFDEWESSPFRDGHRGLHELADSDFSGIVEAGRARLCMLNGTVVGILDGDIDDFEGASGTAYEAPSPALPLLALMQERNDEVRAKYYSEDTPLSEVDDTLSDGGFTGFIELSENVLSGDYYVVYHRGRSMAVAWVGNSGQLLTDDEAFERADGEVGIFQVRPAEIEPIEIPEVDDSPDAAGGADDVDGTAAAAGGTAAGSADAADDADGEFDTAGGSDATVAEDSTTGSEPSAGGATAEPEPTETDSAGPEPATDPEPAADPEPDEGAPVPAESTADGDGNSGGTDTDTSTGGSSEAAEQSADGRTATDRRERAGGSTADRRTGATDTGRAGDTETSSADAGEADARTEPEPDRESGTSSGREPDPATDRGSGANAGRTESPGRRGGESAEPRTGDARSSDPAREGGRDRSGGGDDPPRRTPDSGARTDEPQGTGGGTDSGVGAGAEAATSPDQLETHSIPSLDPSRTTSRESDDGGAAAASASDDGAVAGSTEPAAESPTEERAEGPTSPPRQGGDRSGGRPEPRNQGTATGASETRSEPRASEPQVANGSTTGSGTSEPETGRADERVAELEDELADREREIEQLEADLAAAEDEREQLRSQLEEVRAERDDLQSRIDRVESEREELERERDELESEVGELESEVERLEGQLAEIEEEFGAAVDAEQRLSPGEALDQTNLFVRYGSKGKPTLETAHAGEAGRQEVAENLGLEYHTQFDSERASVGGRPFDEFLRDTMQFRFVTWVIEDLLYEIRDTGKMSALQDLYDAIPKIDRAELNGSVSTEYTEDGQERRSQESFDVVMRDRMGNALMVANMNDSRQAASESMMSSLVTASSHVGESTESLGASFLVTSSFFEPEALETASEATSGGLLSRDKRESFVKLTRKQGYHLCLVEAREEKFHLAVPEL